MKALTTRTSPPLHTEDSLANYDILGPLGRGGHSFVYKARSKATSKLVALKVIDITTAKLREQVQMEIRIHSGLSHRNIIRLLDHFHDETYHYLVLEFCEHGELYTYLQSKQGKLPEHEIKVFLAQILEGLKHLKSKGIVHRDVKLGNLLLDSNLEVKISDFGLSITTKDAETACAEKMSGTPNYLAPEVITKRVVTPACDIWSLGCVAYALCEGILPFEGSSTEKTLHNIVKGALVKPRKITGELTELIDAMLLKDHLARPDADKALGFSFFKEKKTRDELTVSTLELESIAQIGDSSLNFYRGKKTSSFFSQLKKERNEGKEKEKEKERKMSPKESKPMIPSIRKDSLGMKTTHLSRPASRGSTLQATDFGLVKTRVTMEAIIDSMKKQPFLFNGKFENHKTSGKAPIIPTAMYLNQIPMKKQESCLKRFEQGERASSKGHLSVLNRRVGSFCERTSQNRPSSSFLRERGLDNTPRTILDLENAPLKGILNKDGRHGDSKRNSLGGLLSKISNKM